MLDPLRKISSESNRAGGSSPEITQPYPQDKGRRNDSSSVWQIVMCGPEQNVQHHTSFRVLEASSSSFPPNNSLQKPLVRGLDWSGGRSHLARDVTDKQKEEGGRCGAALVAALCGVLEPPRDAGKVRA